MPPKLQVDESFAFLFTCIEASGCKVDFKLVGDATDLQPAAARMRYTRLRKAVEAGHFKGATLTQPTPISSSLSQLANPHSRRIGHAPHYGRQQQQQQQTFPGPAGDGSGVALPKRAIQPINLDEEEEEEDEEEDLNEPESLLDWNSGRKRQVSNTAEAETNDQQLFFPDTSQSSRSQKRIKRSDSDVEEEEDEEDEDYTPSKSKRNTRTLTRQLKTGTTPTQSREYSQQGFRKDGPTDKYDVHELSTLPVGVSTRTAHANEQHPNNDRRSLKVSRKKQSANTAAEAAYEMGIRTGRWAPHPDDQATRDDHITDSYSVDHIPHLRYIGQGVHSIPDKSIWNNVNTDSNMSNRNVPTLQGPTNVPVHNPHIQHPGGPSPFHQSVPGPFSTEPVPPPAGYQSCLRRPNESDPSPQAESYPLPRRYDPSDPNRFHPASVFEGFRAPTMLTYSPSTLASTNVKKIGEPSLLQKLRMDRQKDAEEKAARSQEKDEKESVAVDLCPHIKQRGRSGQPGAESGVTDNITSTSGVGAHETGSNTDTRAHVYGSNSYHHDRPYIRPRTDTRGSSASTRTITIPGNIATDTRNDKVSNNENQEVDHGTSQQNEI